MSKGGTKMNPSEKIDTVSNQSWAEQEFEIADFGDKRLNKRLLKIADAFSKQPDASIPKSASNWAATKATYNFFDNERVSKETVLSSHIKSTTDRVATQVVVLCVQDTTSLNYSTHPETEGLGTIGSHSENTIGIMIHDTMAFTPEGVALGLIDLQTWTRPKEEYGKKSERKTKPISEKESNKWLKSFEATQNVQSQTSQTTLVNIADRESDIYEFLELATRNKDNPELLLRANYNRLVDHPEKYLWDFMANQKVSGFFTLEVPRQKNRQKRKAELSVRYAKVVLKRPNNIITPDMPKSITVWAILVEEENPPKNVEPITWLLLTTIPINSFEEAVEKVQWYTVRWQIELFHKVLKSGCKTEDRQLTTAEKLVKCLIIDAIIAWRILLLTKLGRKVPQLPCSVVFEEYEWKALYCYLHKTTELPDKEPTLQEAIRMMAKLGGFLGRKGDGEPGVMTIWRGLMRLQDIADTWLLVSPFANSFTQVMGKG